MIEFLRESWDLFRSDVRRARLMLEQHERRSR